MFVIRPPVAACAAASSREAGGAEVSSTGGMRAVSLGSYGLASAPASALMAHVTRCTQEAIWPATGSRPSSARATAPRCSWRSDPHEDRIVALHVARSRSGRSPPCASWSACAGSAASTHPHLLGVYGARTLDGRAVAVAQAPPGRRLDAVLADGPIGSVPAVRIARQVASAVDALEDSGAEPPPLSARRIWVDGAGDAHLDGLDGSGGLTSRTRPRPRPPSRGCSTT